MKISSDAARSSPRRFSARLFACAVMLTGAGQIRSASAQMVSDADLARLDMKQSWMIDLPIDGGDVITRAVALDDNLYLLTFSNRVFAVHVHTGILRWAADVTSSGDMVRGPTHNDEYAVFTTPGAVRLLDRRTGLIAGEQRHLTGVVVEIKHDTAEVNLGEVHGLKGGEILNVYIANEYGDREGEVVARIALSAVTQRYSKGRMTILNPSIKPLAGYKVEADLTIPLEEVKLPFAASSPAVANRDHLFVAAANQRFYSIDIHRDVTKWQLLTPNTSTVTPIIDGKDILIAGQDGLVTCCTQAEKAKNWTFTTEGPIFANMLLNSDRLFVASSDRSLYCLDRLTGKRIWRERFDSPLSKSPVVSDGRVYLEVSDAGLYVLDSANGTQLWRRPQGGQFLLQIGKDAMLLDGDSNSAIYRLDAAKGTRKEVAALNGVRQVTSSAEAQAILLASADGHVISLRSRSALRVRPDDVAAVLHDATRVRIAAQIDAEKAAAVKKPVEEQKHITARDLMFDDDLLSSRSTAKPAGGHGLVEVDGESSADKKPAEDGDEKEAAEGEDGEKETTDAADESDDESDTEKDAESDDKSGDDKEAGDDEEGDDDGEAGDDDESGDDEEDGDDDTDDEDSEDDDAEDDDDSEDDDGGG